MTLHLRCSACEQILAVNSFLKPDLRGEEALWAPEGPKVDNVSSASKLQTSKNDTNTGIFTVFYMGLHTVLWCFTWVRSIASPTVR
jgi:hypothetical protein